MSDIDEIMKMLDKDNDIAVQQKGIELARTIKNIRVFIRPNIDEYARNVWENCAKVLSSKSDEELKPYLNELLEWLEDLSYPGSLIIFDRITDYQDLNCLKQVFNECIKKAKGMHQDKWIENLYELMWQNKQANIKFKSGVYYDKDWSSKANLFHEDVVKDKWTAIFVAQEIYNSILNKNNSVEFSLHSVFYDEDDKVWIVSFNNNQKSTECNYNYCNIAIQQNDCKVLCIWFEK